MWQKTKLDQDLGIEVEKHLKSLNLHTPTTDKLTALSNSEKIDIIEKNIREILETLGLDLTDDSLEETPKRVAKMYVLETLWGLEPTNFPKCTAVDDKMQTREMVVVDNITVMSQCEHHLVTIDGFAHVAYIPNGKVLGLSKINRIVEYFARRPQIQERLTKQIQEAVKFITDSEDVAVVINATHYCVKSRGVSDQHSQTTTSALSGLFFDEPKCRAEFMSHVNNSKKR